MNRRKGFTLTEILIVIAIIGILMAMMTTKSTEAIATTRASNIMANLRTMKQAAVAIFLKSRDQWEEAGVSPTIKDVMDYMIEDAEYVDYHVYVRGLTNANTAAECEWYVCYKFPEYVSETVSIKNKLSGRATSTGLRAIEIDPDTGYFTGVSGVYTAEYQAVGMRVR